MQSSPGFRPFLPPGRAAASPGPACEPGQGQQSPGRELSGGEALREAAWHSQQPSSPPELPQERRNGQTEVKHTEGKTVHT